MSKTKSCKTCKYQHPVLMVLAVVVPHSLILIIGKRKKRTPKMIEKEIADMLDGLKYGEEIRDDILKYAKENGAVIVFGASDDLMEFRGAVEDEVSCDEGGCAYFDRNGLLKNKCNNEDCPYFQEKLLHAKHIEAVWDSEGYSWIYVTDIPHETFEIVEEGQKYCRGIVFSMGKI